MKRCLIPSTNVCMQWHLTVMQPSFILCTCISMYTHTHIHTNIDKQIKCMMQVHEYIYASRTDENKQKQTYPIYVCCFFLFPSIIHITGIFSNGWGQLASRAELQHVHFCFSSYLYFTPFFHFLTKLTSQPSPCDKHTILDHMRNKRSMALIPGGACMRAITI